MKFILGYIKGSVCPVDPSRPIVWVILKTLYENMEYRIERFKRDPDTGLMLPQLQVYDSDDFPPAVIADWLAEGRILECVVKSGEYAGVVNTGETLN